MGRADRAIDDLGLVGMGKTKKRAAKKAAKAAELKKQAKLKKGSSTRATVAKQPDEDEQHPVPEEEAHTEEKPASDGGCDSGEPPPLDLWKYTGADHMRHTKRKLSHHEKEEQETDQKR